MINSPQTSTDRRFRLGASSVIRHVARKPSALLSVGGDRISVEVIGAVSFDAHIRCETPLAIGQRVTLTMTDSVSQVDVAVPGIVHWTGSSETAGQAGLMLLEPIADTMAVRIPGCQRNSIRYSCRIDGWMTWSGSDGHQVSTAAVTMNYARDGICCQVACAPPVETPVQFHWRRGGNSLHLDGVVRWVIGQEGGFLTGCELTAGRGYRLAGLDG